MTSWYGLSMRHLTIAAATVALVAASSPQTRAAGASPSRVTFGHLTVEDGLAHSYVQAILKDSQGFMWFGTEDGLNRWDGKEFRVYRPQAGDARSLISPTVGVLFEDSKKRLWTGTANRLAWGQGGLALYDRDSDSFTRYMRGDRSDTLSGMAIQAITEDRQGFLWIGTEKGLNRFDPEHNVFTRHQHDPGNPHSLSDDYVNCVLEDRAGRLWVGTNNGLNRFDRATNSFYRWPQDSLPHPNVSALYEDATQKLWVGSMGGGLSRLDPATGQVTRFLPIPNDPTSLSHPNVRRLAGDGRGTLYVGTENGGLNTLDPVSHRFSRFLPNPEDPTSPNSASIYALYLDEHGTLWIGSYNGGVDILSQYAQRFEYIRAGRGRLSDPHVTAVIEDHTGDLWIGTDGGGLNRRDHETGRFTDYRHDPADQGSIASDVVLSLWEDRQGDIWIGGFPGGLAQLDRQTGRCRRYQIDASDTRRDTV